ncbi:FAD-binding oxidoreductase [Aquipuribacter sp. SD81]|uniref:FAD-binding oxidoreductase n=1 Tax=Aquipuribacter sp. SD81 TaxID=3127703 RepID=UPI003016D11E
MSVSTPSVPVPAEPPAAESVETSETAETAETAEAVAVASVLALRHELGELVRLPSDDDFDAARTPWNVAVAQHPAAVALPQTAEDVVRVVRAAARHGLRVAPQGTGHGAGPLGEQDLSRTVLLRTTALRDVTVDPVARTARVGAGAVWDDVVPLAAEHALAALHGSSPDVGVAGFCLGGGIGWYARAHGLATNAVRALEVVTAGGDLVRCDADTEPDLFWALRGGGGGLAVVTALEIGLLPVADAYAGMLLWDGERAPDVVRAWARWTADLPEDTTTSCRVLRLPPLPELPPFLSGRTVVVVDGAVLADDATGTERLAALRALAPEIDTFARTPATAVTRIHMDPEGPTPSVGGSRPLRALEADTVEAFLAAVGPGAPTSLLVAELRHLGGALARPAAGGGVLDHLPFGYVAFFAAVTPFPEAVTAGRADVAAARDALAPWDADRVLLNFVEDAGDTSKGYAPAAWQRLQAVRAAVDPTGLLQPNHVAR